MLWVTFIAHLDVVRRWRIPTAVSPLPISSQTLPLLQIEIKYTSSPKHQYTKTPMHWRWYIVGGPGRDSLNEHDKNQFYLLLSFIILPQIAVQSGYRDYALVYHI